MWVVQAVMERAEDEGGPQQYWRSQAARGPPSRSLFRVVLQEGDPWHRY